MQDETKSTRILSPNAFSREFLDKLYDREEAPFAALECEARGPWVAIERPVAASVHRGERWAVHRSWESARMWGFLKILSTRRVKPWMKPRMTQ